MARKEETKHLISAADLTLSDTQAIFEKSSKHLKRNLTIDKKHPSLKGRTQINLFFENSTRTRTSFELAGKRLGADVINISTSSSSISKGESLLDTALTVSAMQPDIIVIRHPKSGSAQLFVEHCDAAILNAGDGSHQHPTQAILDSFTLLNHFGSKDLKGKKIAICGDILHSRVARSNIALLKMLGAEINLVAPKTLLPKDTNFLDSPIFHNMNEGIKNADVVMLLRLQMERMKGCHIASVDEYFEQYALTYPRLELTNNAVIMHPGPVNRGIEIDTYLVDDRQKCLILDQVEAGVATRQAILEWALGE